MNEWQPIKTAPDDFRSFLAVNRFGEQWICVKQGKTIIGLGERYCSMALDTAKTATHWMPLPEPPK